LFFLSNGIIRQIPKHFFVSVAEKTAFGNFCAPKIPKLPYFVVQNEQYCSVQMHNIYV